MTPSRTIRMIKAILRNLSHERDIEKDPRSALYHPDHPGQRLLSNIRLAANQRGDTHASRPMSLHNGCTEAPFTSGIAA